MSYKTLKPLLNSFSLIKYLIRVVEISEGINSFKTKALIIMYYVIIKYFKNNLNKLCIINHQRITNIINDFIINWVKY